MQNGEAIGYSDYTIVKSMYDQEMQTKVNSFLSSGYVLIGGICVGEQHYYQVVAKPIRHEKIFLGPEQQMNPLTFTAADAMRTSTDFNSNVDVDNITKIILAEIKKASAAGLGNTEVYLFEKNNHTTRIFDDFKTMLTRAGYKVMERERYVGGGIDSLLISWDHILL